MSQGPNPHSNIQGPIPPSRNQGPSPPPPRNLGLSLPPRNQVFSLPPQNQLLITSSKGQTSTSVSKSHGSHQKSQGTASSSRKSGNRVFRRQNSFAGFPSTTLSTFSTNDAIPENASDVKANGVASSTVHRSGGRSDGKHNAPVTAAPSDPHTTASTFSQPHMSGINAPHTALSIAASNNLTKGKKAPTSKVFYSLPRHATTSSNPSLMKTSASGLGLYLMSRNSRNPKKPSAAEQLGVSPAKFLSLPRPPRKKIQEDSVVKIPIYRSLPRPISRTKHSGVFSLPPSEAIPPHLSISPLNMKKMTRDPADGREAESKPRRRDYENMHHSSSVKDGGDQSKRKEDSRLHCQPLNNIPKEHDPKYHPRSRTVVKNDSWGHPPLPKRDEYMQYPYRRIGPDDVTYQVIVKYAEKDPIQAYCYPANHYDKMNPNYRSYPRTERDIAASYHAMYRRPDGEEMTYIPCQHPQPRIPEIDTYGVRDHRPVLTTFMPISYQRDYPNPRPYYHPYQTYERGPIESNVYSYQPPPPIIPQRIDKPPEPVVIPQFIKPIMNDIRHQSLPRKPAKEVLPTYQSLPRRFGRENELRFYPITNIDISDDPGYESLIKPNEVEGVSANEEDKLLQRRDGKENEPRYKTLPPKLGAGNQPLDPFSSPGLSAPFEPLYQAIPQNEDSRYSTLQPPKKRDKSNECKTSSLRKKEENKYQSLPRKKDLDAKYQSLPKRKTKDKEKDYDRPPPPLPKRTPREGGDGKHSSRKTSKDREGESRHHVRRSSRESRDSGDSRSSLTRRGDKSSPAGVRSVRRSQDPLPSQEQPPRSPRWKDPDTDEEDGLYSTVRAQQKDPDPMYQSVPEVAYTRPLPPVPAPSRYRRRLQEPAEEVTPPPLPPPRLTTGPVGPHNPLLNVTIPNVAANLSMPVAGRPQMMRTPSSSPESSFQQINPPAVAFKPKPPEKEDEDPYSSIPSPISSSHGSPPSSLPRPQQNRVTASASWDSLGSSIGSSAGSSRTSSLTSNAKETVNSKRRRRAVSDPRMDANVLNKLAFTVWQTALHIEKENNNEATAPVKQQTISSRNTQSAARTHQTMSTEGSQALGGNKMDLVYVTERIISLVFPPGMKEAGYTLHLREVAHMLSSKHGDTFRVFDISLGGEVSHYLPRVTSLGWANGLAPPLEKLCSICKALDSWLNQHASHIAVLHSRNGYEKMGVVIAAYMHYSNICASTDQALDRYAMKRFFDDKIGQLFHPSQKRYVQYFAGLLSGVIRINSSPLYLHTLTLYGVPHFEPRGGCHLFIKIYQGMTPVYTSGVYNLTETMRQVTIAFESGVQLRGDILLKAYHRRLTPASREVIFRVQFHTCAVSDRVLPFARQQLDDACNDLRFPLDGGIELLFSQYPEDRPGIVSNVSCDKAPCDIAAWDSYENISAQGLLDDQEEAQSVNHTLGPLDGSLYATVSKRRSTTSPHSPTGPSPSPHGPNGRYAASIDSGIASSNSAGAAPISPPTSDTSRASGDAGGTAPVAAPTSRPGSSSVSGKSRVDARQLDELLAGMLLDIQSIPDLRPCQTPAPDIDSIRCPDFSSSDHEQRIESRKQSIRMEIAPPKQYSGVRSPSPMSPVNGYSGSSQNSFMCDDNVPYHARTDSKPFSYGAVTSSPLLNRHRSTSEGTGFEGTSQPPPSPSIHRRNSRETLSTSRVGLESPRLVRRMSGSVGASPADGYRHHSRSPSPSPEPGSRGGTLKRERSNTMTTRIMTGDASPTDTLGRSTLTRSASRLDDATDGSFSHDSFSRSYSSGASTNSSWLQMQQRKLQERRDAKHRSEKGPQEAKMFSELRSRIMQHHHGGRELEDGYISDTTHFSETSRESSPLKTLAPLTINTSASSPPKSHVVYSTSSKGNSAPSSPILTNRGTSSTTRQQAHYSNTMKGISRRTSDASHDRERPFMAVKRAHENSRGIDTVDSSNAFSQLQTSPLGHINYSLYNNSTANSTSGGQNDGLLTTTTHTAASQDGIGSFEALSSTLALLSSPIEPHFSSLSGTNHSSCTQPNPHCYKSGDESAWQSDTDTLGTNRPITPAFPPATPTTPYLNQGLPPKSPTAIRRALLGISPLSTTRPHLQRTVSLPSKELGGLRSPSPATNHYNRQELNGHSSPAPSLYHGQSRRSSLTSLHDSIEVISSHPKFVKDISKFWYKPNISRDDAISMLRDKLPGTFVVRDSNSFPGAFGLALKVSTPPPNVASKSSDPSNELVRHFLIEPTSRGVRLKGCANEPVFGSLSALVYQHSITALALPCRLTLPDRDPAGIQETPIGGTSTGSKTDTNQLLQQGAACNVLYLYSADTESLTGPQAVKRAIQLMLAAKPTPTVVHFKVSSQGITLTDSSRQLFFRRHYPVNTISHCGLDSEDRRWAQKNENGEPVGSLRMFGFVAKKGASRTDNQCHIIAELEPEQPATAICNFVTKVMMTSVNRSNLV